MKKLLISAIIALGLTTSAMAEVNLKGCMGCHGADFSKKALGKSLVVSDMNATEIATAMVGYKDGTYQSANMGGLMKAQLAKYSKEELEIIVKQIKQ